MNHEKVQTKSVKDKLAKERLRIRQIIGEKLKQFINIEKLGDAGPCKKHFGEEFLVFLRAIDFGKDFC